ncbi:hypothetical protein HDU67_005772 [Dinochytrium kinnereticum]|nr:hypothetical protein HDU67_005772 [Dinochytrium kinnereticum]
MRSPKTSSRGSRSSLRGKNKSVGIESSPYSRKWVVRSTTPILSESDSELDKPAGYPSPPTHPAGGFNGHDLQNLRERNGTSERFTRKRKALPEIDDEAPFIAITVAEKVKPRISKVVNGVTWHTREGGVPFPEERPKKRSREGKLRPDISHHPLQDFFWGPNDQGFASGRVFHQSLFGFESRDCAPAFKNGLSGDVMLF